MNKISLIIRREYLTRVKKKSFIIMSIIGPLLFGGFFAGMIWMMSIEDTEIKNIAVVDSTGFFVNELPETETIKFSYVKDTDVEVLKENFFEMDYYGILFIPHIVTYSPNAVQFYSDKQPGIGIKMHIEKAIEKRIKDEKLKSFNIDNLDEILKSVETAISMQTFKLRSDGSEKRGNTELAMILAYLGGLLIYLFVLLFGTQVMRGVIEEKTSRIVEVIVSSVKPFQLMLGKILGIAMVGLTQFIIWIVLTFSIITGVQRVMMPDVAELAQKAQPVDLMESTGMGNLSTAPEPVMSKDLAKVDEILSMLSDVNWGLMIGGFIFFFIGGYLLYGSLFAAIGSAVDSETDTQQFMVPITLPLVLGLIVMFNAMNNPESALTHWFSFIPFTSPIVMMARLPFGPPISHFIISCLILIVTFIFTTWFAGKIYRTGILMYGKKISYKEIWKWLRYKN